MPLRGKRKGCVMTRRYLAAVLALLMIFLSSCSGTGTGDSDSVTLDAAQLKKYIIVRDDYAEGDAVKCAMDVRTAFENADCTLTLKTDFFREGIEAFAIEEKEILVGKTNREETSVFLDSLKPWQYGYGLVNGKIVICGHDIESTQLAANAFISNVLTRSPLYYSSEDDYVFGEIKEGEGREYSVLYADGSAGCDKIVSSLADDDEVLIITGAGSGLSDELEAALSGWICAAETQCGGFTLIYFNEKAFTFSSSGSTSLRNTNTLSSAEKGLLTYVVLRNIETKKKTVFCAGEIPYGKGGDCMSVLTDFLANCNSLNVLAAFNISGDDESAMSDKMMSSGYASAYTMADERTGEKNRYGFFMPFSSLVADNIEYFDFGTRLRFRTAK